MSRFKVYANDMTHRIALLQSGQPGFNGGNTRMAAK